MSAYYALVRLYYQVDGQKVCAPADSVTFDFPEDEVERAVSRGYLREATVGEIAEAEAKAAAAPKKAVAAAQKKRGRPTKAEAKSAETGSAEKSEDGEKKTEDLA